MSGRGITTVSGQKWGCHRCTANGVAKNAMATAAQHNKQKNHPTWSEQVMRTEYGAAGAAKSNGQKGLF